MEEENNYNPEPTESELQAESMARMVLEKEECTHENAKAWIGQSGVCTQEEFEQAWNKVIDKEK